jgi:hypothetical protein
MEQIGRKLCQRLNCTPQNMWLTAISPSKLNFTDILLAYHQRRVNDHHKENKFIYRPPPKIEHKVIINERSLSENTPKNIIKQSLKSLNKTP